MSNLFSHYRSYDFYLQEIRSHWKILSTRKTGSIQALRASLANKQVSEEDCFMILEANPLGFHRHLEGDAWWLSSSGSCRGASNNSCHQNTLQCLCAGCLLQQSLWFILQAALGSGKFILEQKTGSIPPLTWLRGQEGICVLWHTSSVSSHYVSMFTITRHFLWHRNTAKCPHQQAGND